MVHRQMHPQPDKNFDTQLEILNINMNQNSQNVNMPKLSSHMIKSFKGTRLDTPQVPQPIELSGNMVYRQPDNICTFGSSYNPICIDTTDRSVVPKPTPRNVSNPLSHVNFNDLKLISAQPNTHLKTNEKQMGFKGTPGRLWTDGGGMVQKTIVGLGSPKRFF